MSSGTQSSISKVPIIPARVVQFNGDCVMGIDEAGRGPVLGPMVYACAIVEETNIARLKASGVADSKKLNEVTRELLYGKLTDEAFPMSISWKADVIHPQDLSFEMLSRKKFSLNQISFRSAFGLVQWAIDNKIPVKKVFVDTVGDPGQYERRLTEHFPDLEFTVSKKADDIFPIVSAASIVAKVTRDRVLGEWEFGMILPEKELGSGYPGDPATKRWLNRNINRTFGFPNLVRFSWATCETLLKNKCADVKWDDDEDDESNSSEGKRGHHSSAGAPPSKKVRTLESLLNIQDKASPKRCQFLPLRSLGIELVSDI